VFSRFTAWLLIALVALPFTAPFSTCDLSMLMSAVSHGSSRAVIGHGGRSTSIEEAGAQDASASVLDEEQFKNTMPEVVVTIAAPAARVRPVTGAVHRASAHSVPLVALRL